MQQFCLANGLSVRRCGKLVVATTAADVPVLDELFQRGKRNGVDLQLLSEPEVREIEPRARVFERAIFSPSTASVDPAAVMQSLVARARSEGISLRFSEGFAHVENGIVHSQANAFDVGYFVNCAGLYADKISHQFGHGLRYRILPFRGCYLKSTEPAGAFRTHVYPVPDMSWPFLGVHCTITVDGCMKIGPTASPAFWREHYQGLRNISLRELAEVCSLELRLLMGSKFRFRSLALHELLGSSDAAMVARASKLATGLTTACFGARTEPGIRAQLLNVATGQLETDFIVESDNRSLHVLNAVSPAFTCAFPIADHVCDEIERRLGHGGRDPSTLS